MREQPVHVACAAATANGFAMPYRPSAPSVHADKKHNESLPPVPSGLAQSSLTEMAKLSRRES
jgi:hypothetical protein